MLPKVAIAPKLFGTPTGLQLVPVFHEPPPFTFHAAITVSAMLSSMVVAARLLVME